MGRVLLLGVIAYICWATPPSPADHLGYEPGEDYKLADYAEITSYFQKLEEASDRIRLVEFGRSANGRPMYVAFISSGKNLKALDRFREINRRMALGAATPEEAGRLAREGKAIVWIDSGLHSTEVAPAQHAPVLAFRMVTSDDEEIRRIRDNVILMQVPVVNPDGHDWVVEWYRKNLGTPYELAPLPRLYQKYAGHDNNRDWFMLNLVETRHVARLLFEEWFPQIVYNQHEQPAFPARIFVPPYAEPLNPNIPAPVMEGINLIGSAMKERFAREEKPGVLSYFGFDAWWNGGLRTSPAFHNMHGILTETAAGVYATPRIDEKGDLPEQFGNGMPTMVPSVFYQRPWLGGRWGVREAIDYMLTADFAILDLAASRSEFLVKKAYDLARAAIEEDSGPYAYVVPASQWDTSSALEMLRRLHWAGLQIHQARQEFQVGGNKYASGSYVMKAGQPFRPYLVDLMEPQHYPTIRQGQSGPTKRPYDVAGWTLRMSMGVDVDRVDQPFEADLELVDEVPEPSDSYDHRENISFRTVSKLLSGGRRVRWGASGEILAKGHADEEDFAEGVYDLKTPRLAVYESWAPNIDTGWTKWVLDTYEVPYEVIRNEDFGADSLNDRYDTILLASQNPSFILHGYRDGEATRKLTKGLEAKTRQRPEYTGGIGPRGLHRLDQFVRRGGTLIAFDSATGLPVDMFPLALRDVAQSGDPRYYCPGSLIHIELDTTHPITFGMPAEPIAFSRGGQAFETELLQSENKGDREIRIVGRYAKKQLLASGWVSGEKAVAGKGILVDARHGEGRVFLFGFRPQFRGQTFGTFKLLLNAVFLSSAREVR